jgi:acyl CoA:acetate/3-ketoacid CoA transferase
MTEIGLDTYIDPRPDRWPKFTARETEENLVDKI